MRIFPGLLPILLLLSGLLLAPTWAATRLQLITTDYPPYCAADLPEQGVFTALTQAAFRAGGYETDVVFKPWARALAEIKAGKHDAILAVWFQSERNKFLAFTDPLWLNRIGFMGRAGELVDTQHLSTLKGRKIGVVRGYANPPEFEAANLTVDEAVDDETNLKKLLGGRVDLALVDKALAEHLIRNRIPEADGRLAWQDPPIATMPLYVALSRSKPGYEQRLLAFNRGLAEIRRTGEYERILKRHGITQ
ncbi:substrate-binding periplasmic protein [Chitinimonas sp. JJ19]|uniref:substrate-binding periplasmic protein n=1 Tax=Chitinimonas sp. JJ19 TaxID=3109352 RepID=UPI0030010E31